MAGKPGKSGGARVGAGRKPKTVPPLVVDVSDPLAFLEGVMRDANVDPTLRVRAAVTVAQYRYLKLGEGGKKQQKEKDADCAATGKFAPTSPPRLVVVKK